MARAIRCRRSASCGGPTRGNLAAPENPLASTVIRSAYEGRAAVREQIGRGAKLDQAVPDGRLHGDVTSAMVSAVAFVHAARSGVPKILLARMAMNILINELVGIIPGLGDAFSFWFKSNVRNYELLRRSICRARAIEKRRLDICHRGSQSAVCHCLRGIDRDGPRIGGYWAFPLPPISTL